MFHLGPLDVSLVPYRRTSTIIHGRDKHVAQFNLNESMPMTMEPESGGDGEDPNLSPAALACASWAKIFDPESGTCYKYLDLGEGYRYMWNVYCILFPVLFFIMALLYAHGLTRTIATNSAKSRRRWYGNANTYTYFFGCIGSMLMAIACIDGWGFFYVFSVRTYLSIYAPGVGIIQTTVISLAAIGLFDDHVVSSIRGTLTIPKTYSYGSIVFMSLCCLYGSVGYAIFGWILAKEIAKNPETTLGITGNYLIYASLALQLVILLVCITPLLYVSHSNAKTLKKMMRSNDDMKRMSRKTQTWFVRQFLSCAFLLIYLTTNDYLNKNGGLLATLLMLFVSRGVEVFLLLNTYDLLKPGMSKNVEYIMFQYWYIPLVKSFKSVDSAYNTDDTTASYHSSGDSSVTMDAVRPGRRQNERSGESEPKAPVNHAQAKTNAKHKKRRTPKKQSPVLTPRKTDYSVGSRRSKSALHNDASSSTTDAHNEYTSEDECAVAPEEEEEEEEKTTSVDTHGFNMTDHIV